MLRIICARFWLAIGLVVFVVLVVAACGPAATQPSATPEEPAAMTTQPPTPTSEESIAEPTPSPTPTPEEFVAEPTQLPTPTSEEPVEQPQATASLEDLLTSAQEALEAGDPDKARHELEGAREVAEGSTLEVVEDLIEDLEKAELTEVEERLRELLGEETTPKSYEADADIIEAGRALFQANACAACHGPEAQGTEIGPALPGRTAEQIRRQVRDPLEKMPPFTEEQVSDDELEKIIAFITSLAPP